ncbi:E3 ubiquitin-protein ligase RNF4-like [Antennarius striatus]|uniref:E3 ubiquitin-protein ligase RNF4-like n=1 Tax=Antennarius striatus TaxID=241820 RepID=UPI0035B40868
MESCTILSVIFFIEDNPLLFVILLLLVMMVGKLVKKGPQNREVPTDGSDDSSDEEEDTPPVVNTTVMSSLHSGSATRSTPGMVSCPVCLDSYSEIVKSGRLVVSTKCGHVFCRQCLRDALDLSHKCPTCRKRVTPRRYHPLYI